MVHVEPTRRDPLPLGSSFLTLLGPLQCCLTCMYGIIPLWFQVCMHQYYSWFYWLYKNFLFSLVNLNSCTLNLYIGGLGYEAFDNQCILTGWATAETLVKRFFLFFLFTRDLNLYIHACYTMSLTNLATSALSFVIYSQYLRSFAPWQQWPVKIFPR